MRELAVAGLIITASIGGLMAVGIGLGLVVRAILGAFGGIL